MQTVTRWLRVAAAVLVVFSAFAAVAQAMGTPAAPSVLLFDPSSLVGLCIGMIAIPWDPPMTRADLQAISDPQAAGQPEVVPWALFDTQSLATATSAPLTFFQSSVSDKTMSNMEGPGQLPDPQHFVVHYIACDILQIPKATALAGEPNEAMANMYNILHTTRATFEVNMSNKKYGAFPLAMCHALGGVTGFGYGYGTAANGTSAAAVNNGIPGSGGFPFSGAIILPPKIGFDVTIRFGAATTLVNGPINIRMTLVGALYRRVL